MNNSDALSRIMMMIQLGGKGLPGVEMTLLLFTLNVVSLT